MMQQVFLSINSVIAAPMTASGQFRCGAALIVHKLFLLSYPCGPCYQWSIDAPYQLAVVGGQRYVEESVERVFYRSQDL